MKKYAVICIALFAIFVHTPESEADGPWEYVDRGALGGYEYVVGVDMTCDGTWRDLDVSADVTGDTLAIEVHAACIDNATNMQCFLRENGVGDNYNVLGVRTQVANIPVFFDGMVQVDDSQVVEYLCTSGVDTFSFSIKGYYVENATCEFEAFGLPECVYIWPPPGGYMLEVDEGGSCWGFRPFTHTVEHELDGVQEINVTGLSGILTDTQDAGWFQGLPITITGLTDGQVLVWDETAAEWQPATITGTGGFTMPDVITATISGTVPVLITNTWHYTETLSSGHDIAIMRSFTYGEASIAISLFVVAVILGFNLLFSLQRR